MKTAIPSYKDIWKITWPILIGLFAENIVGAIDTAFLGRVGEVELGASAIASTFYIILFSLGMGFCVGIQILIGNRNGQKNYKEIGSIFDNGAYFIFAIVLFLILFVFLFAEPIFHSILSSPDIADAATRFLKIRVFTLFFSLGAALIRSFFVGITVTKYIGASAIVIGLTNFVLDYLLIFGNWGFPKMGLEGAALASVLCEVVGLAFFLVIIFAKIDVKKYQLFKFKKPNKKIIKSSLDLSVYTMLQNLISLCVWFLFFVIVEKTGEQNLAVTNIVRSFYIMIILPVWAFNSASSTLVSNAIGQGHKEHVMRIVLKVMRFSVAFALIITLICLFIPKELLGIYTQNETLIELGYRSVYIVLIANLLYSFSGIPFSAVSATGNTKIALFLESFIMLFYIAMLLVFVNYYPNRIEVAWCSEVVYYLLLGILSFWYLRTNHWKQKKI